MTKLTEVLKYSDEVYKAKMFGRKADNVPLTVNDVSEVISELKAEYGKLMSDEDKKNEKAKLLVMDSLRKAKYLHEYLIESDDKLFLKGEAEVFKVEKLIEQKPSNKALIYKMDVRVGESPFLMRVNVLNINGKNEDTGESYDYIKIVLPFERTWKEEYEVKGKTREKTVYDYNGMQIDRTGDEWYMDINNSWEDVKGGLLSGFMKVVGIYDREAKRIQREKKAKMKEKNYSQSCKNCRWHISEEIADETEPGITTSFWRHKCVLTGETVDDTAHEFFEQDAKEDKGPLQEAKSIKVNKHSFEEADYRPRTQKSRYIKENALNDFGADCYWHLFHTNFDGSIDGWYSEKPVKGIMPSLQEVYEDKESPVEFMLPNNIIIDFDDVQIVEWEEPTEEDEVEVDKLEIPEAMKDNRSILSDELAREVAEGYCKNEGFDDSQTRAFVDKFVALK